SIRFYLTNKNIKFESQKKFNDCKSIRKLPFDFYLPDYNLCIEYDGIQHFEPIDFFGGINSYKNLIKRYAIKSNFCYVNGIELLRIKYNDNINDKLSYLIN